MPAKVSPGNSFVCNLPPVMTVNLVGPYQSLPSNPRSLDLVFSAPGYDAFLFTGSCPPKIICQPFRRGLSLEWTLSRNRVDASFLSGSAEVCFDNSFEIEVPSANLEPGFFDLHVVVRLSDHEELKGISTFGWRVAEMSFQPLKPADFREFWNTALKAIDVIQPEPCIELDRILRKEELGVYNVESACLPESYDPEGERVDEVEVYKVKFQSCAGREIQGWFTKPVGDGPFPALLVLPGAGNNPRPAPVEHARHGYAALDIQVHGNPVDAAEYAEVPGDMQVKSPQEKIHFAIYLNALQGARALKMLPGVHRERLAILGGSQGGRLTLVVAALDPSFRAAIPAITHFAYMPWLRWTDSLNRKKSPGAGAFTGAVEFSESLQIESYFDVLNFAPLVRCPVLMNAGLIDRVSPPTGIFAVYDALETEKQIIPLPNTAHDWAPAFDRYAWRWLERKLSSR